MSQPAFYIFGVPNGFDLLDGDLAATNYFQNYYNPSKENTKFSIHRNAGDGMITYAYLKYNLTSGKGREGSFFGMALVFTENSCCTDFLKLYRLFDTIYDKVILADSEILEPTDGSSYIQAKYKITRFNEKREYIMQKVLPNLLSNLNTFADAFIPVDDTFSSSQPDLGVRIPYDNADNKKILNTLRHYNRLSISPSWSGPEPAPEISIEVLYRWHQEFPKLSLYVNKCFQNISRVNISEVRKEFYQSSKICETFKTHTYPKNASDEVIQCYNETKDQYKELYKSFKSLITQIEEKTTPLPPPIPPTPWWKNPKTLGIMGAALIVVITLIFIIVVRNQQNKQREKEIAKQEEQEEQEEQVQIISDVRKYINAKDFREAKKILLKIDEPLHTQLADSIVFCALDDITGKQGFQDYTNTWKHYREKFSSDHSKIRQMALDTVANRRWRYIETLVVKAETAKTNKDKETAKKAAEGAIKLGEGTELHNVEKAQEFRSRLNNIQIIEGGAKSAGSTSPAPPSAPQYQVKLFPADYEKWEKNGDTIKITERKRELHGKSFVYCIATQAGNGIDDPGCIQAPDSLKMRVRKLGPGWYGTNGEGVITVKKGNFECEITIKYEQ